MLRVCLALLFVIAILPAAASAKRAPLVGEAVVIDGGTIFVGDDIVHLWGVDAPEKDQIGTMSGEPWPCGLQAIEVLKTLLLGATVECERRGRGDDGRSIAVCYIPVPGGKADVGALMVRLGWAWALRGNSPNYKHQEDLAKGDKGPLWAGTCQPPWEWRAQHPPETDDE